MKHIAQVHRFRGAVACFVGDGATTYLTANEARKMALALVTAANSCDCETFAESTCGSVEITRADDAPDPRDSEPNGNTTNADPVLVATAGGYHFWRGPAGRFNASREGDPAPANCDAYATAAAIAELKGVKLPDAFK